MEQSIKEHKTQINFLMSKEEKDTLLALAKKENFATVAQFVRSRCLSDNMTNSELADLLMTSIGKKIIEDLEKQYPEIVDEKWARSTLKIPKESCAKVSMGHIGSTNIKRLERTLVIGFSVTELQKCLLEKNAKIAGFKTVSKYIRARCLKEQILKKEVLQLINNFVKSKLEDLLICPDKRLEWKKQKVKKDLNLSFATLGLSDEKKELFEKSLKNLTEAYSNEIQEELTSLLQKQRLKVESAA